jgi:solute carrier family 13 (sodium-dependent dicarboxylate transporter), member 2/3/5
VKNSSLIKLVLGPLLAILFLLFVDLDTQNPLVSITAAIAIWMAFWWITEAVPLAVTALLPIVLYPALGVMSGKDVAPIYFNHIIFLFIGGFLVALAMRKWNLHRRIALKILMVFGTKPRNILLGFILATAFLSMWISNTATTMMMVPIALSIVYKLEEMFEGKSIHKFSIGIFLGIAHAATIGGVSTLVGTPPNLSFARILTILFPNAPEISFATWMIYALPLSIVFIVILWLILSFIYTRNSDLVIEPSIFRQQYKELGKISFEEKIVLIDFILLALLWVSRANIDIGNFTIPGWSQLFSNPSYFNDGTVAIAMALILFLIPSVKEKGKRILDWDTAAKLPWNIVILFGGGFALASGFKESGLADFLGQQMQGFGIFHPIIIVLAICIFVTFLTELTSNTATAEMLLPIIGGLAIAVKINPLFLMIPATISCSFAFMLPVATPPNAIIFGTNRLKISEMAKTGVWLNVIGAILITISIYVVGKAVFGIDLAQFPEWAIN